MRLKTRLALVATLFTSIFVVCYSFLLLLEVPERADAETAGTMPWVLNLLPDRVGPEAASDAARIEHLIELVRGLDRIRHVRVALYRPDGRLVASTPTAARAVPAWLSNRLSQPRAAQRKEVRDGGRVVGYFEVSPAVNDELAELWEDFKRSMMLIVGLSVVAIALIVWSTFLLLAPLDRIANALRALAAGQRTARLPKFSSAEMDGIASSFNRMADALALADAERQSLLRKLVDSDEQTRRSVAHDLHDDLSPYLVALQPLVRTLQLQCARRPDLADLTPIVDTVVAHQSHVLGRLKAILSGLHPPELATWGLRGSIEQMLGQPLANSRGQRIAVRFEPGGAWLGFGPTLDVSIFRLVQECITNVQRHSGARSVDVTFGTGIDADGRRMLRIDVLNDIAAAAHAPGIAGMGILGMQDRCVALGGTFDAGPIDGGRWHTRIRLPVDDEQVRKGEAKEP